MQLYSSPGIFWKCSLGSYFAFGAVSSFENITLPPNFFLFCSTIVPLELLGQSYTDLSSADLASSACVPFLLKGCRSGGTWSCLRGKRDRVWGVFFKFPEVNLFHRWNLFSPLFQRSEYSLLIIPGQYRNVKFESLIICPDFGFERPLMK